MSGSTCGPVEVVGDMTAQYLQQLQTFGGGGFLELALLFFVLALIAAVVGARGIAGIGMSIAKWLVIIFVVLAIVSLLL